MTGPYPNFGAFGGGGAISAASLETTVVFLAVGRLGGVVADVGLVATVWLALAIFRATLASVAGVLSVVLSTWTHILLMSMGGTINGLWSAESTPLASASIFDVLLYVDFDNSGYCDLRLCFGPYHDPS